MKPLLSTMSLSPPSLLPCVAPIRRAEYPLFSHGGLGCESVRQGSGSAGESSAQVFFVPFCFFLFLLRRIRRNSTRKLASDLIRSSTPKCAGAVSGRSAEAARWPFLACRIRPLLGQDKQASSTWRLSVAASGRPRI